MVVSAIISWNFILLLLSVGKNTLADNNEIKCGQSSRIFEKCFEDLSPADVAFLNVVKIPISLNEINKRCMIFNRGMKCADEYVTKCIDKKEAQIIENELYGAKKFFKKLCADKKFQIDYLSHKECFYHIQHDWDKCSNQFSIVLKEEMNKLSDNQNYVHFMHFCCARYGYESCVYNSAKYKCKRESALYIRGIANMLSKEKQFQHCDNIEKQYCSRAGLLMATFNLISLIIILNLLNVN